MKITESVLKEIGFEKHPLGNVYILNIKGHHLVLEQSDGGWSISFKDDDNHVFIVSTIAKLIEIIFVIGKDYGKWDLADKFRNLIGAKGY